MKRHREKMAIYKLRRRAWNRFFPYNHQEELTPLTPISILYSITAENRKTFLYLICIYPPCQDSTLLYFLT